MRAEIAQRRRLRALPARPTTSRRQFVSTRVVQVCAALLAMSVCVGSLRADVPIIKLRVAWGGGEATTWQGSIHVRGGRIIEKQSLGVEADEPGSMWLEDGRLLIRQKSSRQYDGVDISIVAPLDSQLVVVLDPVDQSGPARPVEIELPSLIGGQHSSALPGDAGNRLLIRRSPGDRLRVRVLSPSLVFAPDEVLRLELQPHLLGVAGGAPVKLQTRILRARSDAEISSQEFATTARADGDFADPLPIDLPVPEVEGVYDLVISAAATGGRSQFAAGNPFRSRDETLAERRVQFIVLGEASPDAADINKPPAPDKQVAEINPAQPWWKRVTQLPTLPGFGKGPLQRGDVQPWQHPSLGKLTRLGPSPAEGDVTWVAYPLSIDAPGQVHILEVEYPNNVPQAMGISVLEPNAAGAVLPIGLDSGLVVSDESAGDNPQLERHRIVFWPKTKEPALLITNGRKDAPAVHGRIRVLGPKSVGVAALPWSTSASSRLPSTVTGGLPQQGRIFAGYMERPLLPENFSATEAFDAWSQRSMDDWVTFYDAGRRAIEYLKYAGHNALVISVMAGGSTIYPSQTIEPTPRYDTGIFFSTGQDPVRKDVLEMLFRMCDREGIRLIPALQFSAPLPEVEQSLRRGGADTIGIELVDSQSRPWEQAETGDAHPARYNPLHPRVQQAMLSVVRELVVRYRNHDSLAGVAIGTSGHGFAVLPGPNWGYDAATVNLFSREMGAQLNAPGQVREEAPQDFVSRLLGTDRAAWLDWRARRIRALHGRIADEVRSVVPNSKLYVATTAMHSSRDVKQMLLPALPARATPSELLLGLGIQPALYADADDGIVLVRSRLATSGFSNADHSTALQVDHSVEMDRGFAEAGKPGSLLQSQPEQLRIASFDAKSPFGAAATHTMIVPHLVAAGSMGRKLFANSMAAADSDDILMGGWMLPLGQEDALRDMIAAFRRLPTGQYETVAGLHEPIVARRLSLGTSTFVYLVNNAPWKCQITMRTDVADDVPMLELSDRRDVAAPKRGRWSLTLDRYDFVAVRFDRGNVNLSDIAVTFDKDVRGLLRQRINDLSDRTVELKRRTVVDVLENPKFELPGADRQLSGWSLVGAEGIAAELDPRERHGGAASARLSSMGNVASLISDRFRSPATGRISFTVWLKMSPDFRGPLRLAIGGRHGDREFYRFGVVPKSDQWQVFEFQVDDLPLTGLTDLQVRFDLMGQGQVWIDDIAVSDLRFSDNERKELSRILTHAHFALNGGNLEQCARILDGYWPRFLRQHVELNERAVPAADRPIRQAELPQRDAIVTPAEEKKPWWKINLPGFLK